MPLQGAGGEIESDARLFPRPLTPVPMATIDSPSAMITISEKRSAKWPAETRNPLTPKT